VIAIVGFGAIMGLAVLAVVVVVGFFSAICSR
jgi:hypothetical protein